MQTLTTEQLIERLGWRCAIKKFDPTRKVPEQTWGALERSLVLSPSSYGLQPWRFTVVRDPAVREKLKAVSWNQPQITDASHLVVFASRKGMTVADVDRYVERIVAVRGVDRASVDGYRNTMVGTVQSKTAEQLDLWCSRQTYIALGVFLTSTAVLGIDACPMEGITGPEYDKILGLDKAGYQTLCVATAGYRAADDPYSKQAKVRFAHEDVVKHV